MTVAVPTKEATLVLTSPLESGEELREAVRKACKLNGFTNTSIALNLAGCRSAQRLSALAVSDNVADLCAVSKLLGIPDDNKLLATVLTPSKGRSRDYVSFFGHHVRRGHIARTRRIAPQSMKHKSEMKAIWSLKPLSFDPTTREMLLDRCPNCQNYLGWEKSWDPWICEHCLVTAGGCGQAFDLRSVSMPIFQPSDPKALDFVAFMLDPVSDGRRVDLPTGSVFKSTPFGDLFQLAVRIALSCQRNQKSKSDVQVEAGFLELAGRAILDWPNGFLELVEKTPAVGEDVEALGWFRAKPLRQLLYEPTLSSEIRLKIKRVLEGARRSEGMRRGSGAADHSRQKISSQSSLQRPRSALFALLSPQPDLVRPYSSFEASMTVLRDTREVRHFAKSTGVTIPEVLRLYLSGLAPELIPILGGTESNTKTKITRDLHSSIRQAARPGMTSGALDLVSARFVLDPGLKSSWVAIFEAIINRRLPVWSGGQGNASLASSLYVSDFECLRCIIREQGSDPDVANALLSQEDLSILIRRSLSYTAGFVRSGALKDPLSMRVVARLRENWAFGFELDSLRVIEGIPQDRSASRLLRHSDVNRMLCGPTTLWSREEALRILNLTPIS